MRLSPPGQQALLRMPRASADPPETFREPLPAARPLARRGQSIGGSAPVSIWAYVNFYGHPTRGNHRPVRDRGKATPWPIAACGGFPRAWVSRVMAVCGCPRMRVQMDAPNRCPEPRGGCPGSGVGRRRSRRSPPRGGFPRRRGGRERRGKATRSPTSRRDQSKPRRSKISRSFRERASSPSVPA